MKKAEIVRLELLKSLYREVQLQLRGINEQINEIKNRAELPELRKKYEDTYWIFTNSGGQGESWNLYSHVTKVNDCTTGTCDTFQLSPDGIFVRKNEASFLGVNCEKKITKRQWTAALNKMKSEINKL